VRIFALSVDPPAELKDLQEKVGETVTLLADPEGAAVETFGMRDPAPFPPGDQARSGSFLIDAKGVVRHRWLPAHYHERPAPSAILERLR
jgi:peroxiredoxin